MSDHFSNQLSQGTTGSQDADLLLSLEVLIGTASGRTVLMWLLTEAGLYSALYGGESEVTHLNIGRRDLGLRLLSKLGDVSPMAYPRMLLDAAADRLKPTEEASIVLDE
jgi:hypothetical protein